MTREFDLVAFVTESNHIERIYRAPTDDEILETEHFLRLDHLSIDRLSALVNTYAPGHKLRSQTGQDVHIGNYYPPPGGPDIVRQLNILLEKVNDRAYSAFEAHCRYESLHPFTDGNGRSGRALWLWLMGRPHGVYNAPLGFLHHFYYQTLQSVRFG